MVVVTVKGLSQCLRNSNNSVAESHYYYHSSLVYVLLTGPLTLYFSLMTDVHSTGWKGEAQTLCVLLRDHSFPCVTLES